MLALFFVVFVLLLCFFGYFHENLTSRTLAIEVEPAGCLGDLMFQYAAAIGLCTMGGVNYRNCAKFKLNDDYSQVSHIQAFLKEFSVDNSSWSAETRRRPDLKAREEYMNLKFDDKIFNLPNKIITRG